ncbi:MAG: TolC family protein, partial [Pseudomonadales bacterium]|nr:TolC family protein [Pseudomonadales bacterium]
QITRHPMVLAIDKQVEKLQEGVQLAREQYKPGWSLEFAYAFRNAERPNGAEVSDVASIVASVDLPFFTKNRQDKRVSSASHQFNAGLDQRLDMLNMLNARLTGELATLQRLNDRIELYENMILPQTRDQSQAALMAYKAEQSDFTEVMRSHIAQLESILQFERLQTDRLKAIATIWYLLPPDTDLTRANADFASGETE